jgi:hypothetical protein
MKTTFNHISQSLASLDTRYIKAALILLALTLSVIGAGAPVIGGGLGG